MIKRLKVFLVLCLSMGLLVGCVESNKKLSQPKKLEVSLLNMSTGLPEEKITSLEAFANKVWAGSKTGLYAYDGVNWAIYQQKNVNALASNIIEGLKVYDNKLWIATDNGACYNDSNKFYSFYTNGRARACIGAAGNTVVGTANGILFRGRNFGKDMGLVENEVTSLCYDSEGALIIGTRAGISRFIDDNFMNFTGPAKTLMGSSLIEVPPSPSNCQLSGNNIKAIVKYGSDIAIASTCGLTITDLSNKWVAYKADYEDYVQKGNGSIVKELISGDSDMPGNIVNALAATEDASLLFVGTDQGLAILADDGKWLKVGERIPDLPKLNITGLAYLAGDLYVSSLNGIYKIKAANSLIESKQEKAD